MNMDSLINFIKNTPLFEEPSEINDSIDIEKESVDIDDMSHSDNSWSRDV